MSLFCDNLKSCAITNVDYMKHRIIRLSFANVFVKSQNMLTSALKRMIQNMLTSALKRMILVQVITHVLVLPTST